MTDRRHDLRTFFAARRLRWAGGILLGLFVAMQLVPYGRDHVNPPVTSEPAWDSPRTRELAVRACYSCHSNQTQWPWYASIAPISWRIQSHVDEGREHLDFSTFDRPQEDAHEAAEVVQAGEMPPWDYVLMHPEARLDAQEKAQLVAGLQATFGGGAGGAGEAGGHEHDGDDD